MVSFVQTGMYSDHSMLLREAEQGILQAKDKGTKLESKEQVLQETTVI